MLLMMMMMMMRTMMMMIMVVMLIMMLEIQPNPPASAKRVVKDLFILMMRMPDPISGWSEIPLPQRGVAVLILVCGGTL